MNDPQIWTLIGVFAAVMLGGMTLMTTLLGRTIDSGLRRVDTRIDALDAKVDARIDALDAKFDAKFDAVDARFDALTTRLDHLDRDVQALMRREFGDGRV